MVPVQRCRAKASAQRVVLNFTRRGKVLAALVAVSREGRDAELGPWAAPLGRAELGRVVSGRVGRGGR